MKPRGPDERFTMYICHSGHEHDRTYTENLVGYLVNQNVRCTTVEFNLSGFRPELEVCLSNEATAVLGYNSQLDHSWVSSGSFMSAAESRKVLVIQWILDHPSSRWLEFNNSTASNSR